MPVSITATENAHRRKIIEISFPAIVAAASRLKNKYRSSLEDIDLTIDDLSQFGSLKAIECYDRLYAQDPAGILLIPDDQLRRNIVGLAMRCIACHIIDVYRMRDRRRAAVAPAELVVEVDESDARRVDLWRRVEPILATVNPRQRAIVAHLWDGLDTEEICDTLRLSANIVRKDIAAIRRVAVC